MAAGPAVAADAVSRASGNAVQLTLLGNTQGSGTFTATNDGHGEHTTGTNQPALALLGGQQLIDAGTLFQDATAQLTDHTGASAGCAGLAGDGATLVAIGDSRCLTPGQSLQLDLGKVDLAALVANVQIVDNQQLDDALSGAQGQAADQLSPVLTQLNAALDQARSRLGDAGLFLATDAVQGVCHASGGTASGSADLANADVYAVLPGQAEPVYLAKLPVAPAPNTRVPVQLDKLLTAVIDGLETNFAQALQGKLTAIDPALDQVQQQLVDVAVAQIAPQLKPVGDNLVNLTLNEQSRPAAGSIAVTALDLNVLPAANQQAGMTVFNLKVGNVACGPNGTLQAAPPADHQVKPPRQHPKVPRSVPAGEATMPTSAGVSGLAAAGLGALLLASVGAGAATYVRRVRG
jgi:hypothetical protein